MATSPAAGRLTGPLAAAASPRLLLAAVVMMIGVVGVSLTPACYAAYRPPSEAKAGWLYAARSIEAARPALCLVGLDAWLGSLFCCRLEIDQKGVTHAMMVIHRPLPIVPCPSTAAGRLSLRLDPKRMAAIDRGNPTIRG